LRRNAVKSNPVEVLRYAFKHGYPKIMDEAAPLTVDASVDKLITCWESTSGIFVVWVSAVR
jgi:hypothetical protein